MIVTVTPNPSIDRTITLPGALVRGAVHRVSSVTDEPGGKGVNVARALGLAGLDALAVLPAAEADPMLSALRAGGVPYATVPIRGAVRTNVAVTERDGTTTKLNEPGAALDAEALSALTRTVIEAAQRAEWIVMSGSLPPGVPANWYADVVAELAGRNCRVAVDTSDAPLSALAASFGRAAPDLIKPNAEELAGLTGASGPELEEAAAAGDPMPVITAARQLVERGARTILVTLGAAGAVLVEPSGSWLAGSPPITPRSTVGAGDSALAGYVRAALAGASAPDRLRMAVAYGSAAASLPGSALPGPELIDLEAVPVKAISLSRSDT
jgi:1-phosphofructokinase